MSKDDLLSAFKKSEPFKEIEKIRKENRDKNKIIRDLKASCEPEEAYYEPQKLKGAFNDENIKYECNGNRDKKLSIEGYLNMIRPYLRSIIDDHKDGWKIQLAMEVSFVSVIKYSNKKSNKDSNYSYPMHIHSDSSFIFISYEANNIIKELFKSLLEEC